MPLQTVFTKEFAPELAGERVGWVSVQEMPDNSDLVGVNVVVATVGNDGAKHGYHQRDGEAERMYSSQSDEGFLAVAGLFVMASREDGIHPQGGVYFRAEERKGDGRSILLNGGSGYPDLVPNDDGKSWADNGQELIGLLKEGLARKDVEEHYPAVYYLLNGMVGHERYRSRSSTRDTAPQELFVPDKTMIENTKKQTALADSVVTALEAVNTEDEHMKKRLTVFSDIPATEVPDAFMKSRQSVAAHERAILTTLPTMLAEQLVYLPIGFRPSGRSWPYMNAVAKTEEEAFGLELAALRSSNVRRANYELDREASELAHRLEFARQGSHVLRLLALSEQQMA